MLKTCLIIGVKKLLGNLNVLLHFESTWSVLKYFQSTAARLCNLLLVGQSAMIINDLFNH